MPTDAHRSIVDAITANPEIKKAIAVDANGRILINDKSLADLLKSKHPDLMTLASGIIDNCTCTQNTCKPS